MKKIALHRETILPLAKDIEKVAGGYTDLCTYICGGTVRTCQTCVADR